MNDLSDIQIIVINFSNISPQGYTLDSSPNARINKTLLARYTRLEQPDGIVLATYIWIDGSSENVRAKDRTLQFIPKNPSGESDKESQADHWKRMIEKHLSIF